MELAAAARQQAVVGDVLCQRVLEDVDRLVTRRALVQELLAAQLDEVRADVRRRVPHARQHPERHLAAEDGRRLQQLLRIVRQPVEARHDDALHRVRNRVGSRHRAR